MEKIIEGFEDYTVDEFGVIRSYKKGYPHIMKTVIHSKNGYESVKLCMNNIVTTLLVHRIVAKAFIPNPNSLPEVNHKNKKRSDNRVENLEWCTRIENLYDSYSTMSPVRNYIKCKLCSEKDKNVIFGEFQSIMDACRYASKELGCSFSSLQKHFKNNGIVIVKSVETN